MNLFSALILGIVEGITEFLPVSSTGHLILSAKLLGLSQTEFIKSFEIMIQLGAILAVVVLYRKTIFTDFKSAQKILAAFVPTAVLGFVLYKVIKKVLLSHAMIVVWSMFLGGIFLIVFEFIFREKKESVSGIQDIPFKKAALIGIFQTLAIIPGVSRSAATIVGGLMLGINRKTIVEFSFLLAVPTMLAATALDLIKNREAFSVDQWQFLSVGFFASFGVAVLSIKFLLHFIKRNNFIPFGIYRILVALMWWALV